MKRERTEEAGSALILSMFVLLLLAGMGVALMTLGQNELKMNRGDLRAKQSFYVAEAGLEDARATMYTVHDGNWDDDLSGAAGPNGTIDFDPSMIEAATFDGNGVFTGVQFSATVDDVPVSGPVYLPTADPPGWYMAYLTNDPANTGGTTAVTDDNERVMITGVGVDSSSGMEVVQAIIVPGHPLPGAPRAAIALLGETAPEFDNGNSNAQDHTGDDCGVPGAPYVPIVGAVTAAGKTQIQADMNRPEQFSSGPYTGEDTIGDLTDPTDPVGGGTTIDPYWQDCASIKELVLELIGRSDYYCTTDSGSCSPPPAGPGQITVIDGDYATGADSGGILLVTGVLTYNGNTEWDGIVLVLGEGRMVRSGGGNGVPSGSVIIANTDPSVGGPYADKSDWCTGGGSDGFGQSSYTTSGNGNSEVTYCSTAIDDSNRVNRYRITEFVQR